MKLSYKDLQVILEALECKVSCEEDRYFPHEPQSKLIVRVQEELEKIENEER